jgi:YVTN family beta-propeller protein
LSIHIFLFLFLQSVNSQTLDQYQIEQNYSKNYIPTIKVGKNPTNIAIDESNNKVYVTNADSNTVSALEVNSMRLEDIRVGSFPNDILIDSSSGYIYVVNGNSNTISVIDGKNNTVLEEFSIGGYISGTLLSAVPDRLYVANRDSGSILVYDGFNHSKINEIQVGRGEISMDIDDLAKRLYITNSDSDKILVFDISNFSKVFEIEVGGNASGVTVDETNHKAYVTHFIQGPDIFSINNTISIIDTNTNNKTREISGILMIPNVTSEGLHLNWFDYLYVANENSTISVLDSSNLQTINMINSSLPISMFVDNSNQLVYLPDILENKIIILNSSANHAQIGELSTESSVFALDQNRETGILYIVNSGSNSISTIHELGFVAGVAFNTNPQDAGYVECGNTKFPTNQYLFLALRTICIAESQNNFQFSSWAENSGSSSRTLNITASPDYLYPFLRKFGFDTSATFVVTMPGNFTANFKALAAPVPPEYWASLFTVVVTALVGSLVIPAAVGWLKLKKQTSRLDSFHQQMAHVYDDDKLDENDINQLSTLNKNISDSYAAGKISNEQYTHLKNEVSTKYQEIFKKKIESITEQNINTVSNIRNKITNTYSNGELSKEHYANLKNEISLEYQEIFKKKIELITNPNAEAISEVKNDIMDAYSDGKITELHYNLLIQKISGMLNNQ